MSLDTFGKVYIAFIFIVFTSFWITAVYSLIELGIIKEKLMKALAEDDPYFKVKTDDYWEYISPNDQDKYSFFAFGRTINTLAQKKTYEAVFGSYGERKPNVLLLRHGAQKYAKRWVRSWIGGALTFAIFVGVPHLISWLLNTIRMKGWW
jgi:hypothetical protein